MLSSPLWLVPRLERATLVLRTRRASCSRRLSDVMLESTIGIFSLPSRDWSPLVPPAGVRGGWGGGPERRRERPICGADADASAAPSLCQRGGRGQSRPSQAAPALQSAAPLREGPPRAHPGGRRWRHPEAAEASGEVQGGGGRLAGGDQGPPRRLHGAP
eukprot:1195591-Prorocentrum_minimum.AAC.3